MVKKKRKKREYRPQRASSGRRNTKKMTGETIVGVYRQHHDGIFGFIDVVDDQGEKKGYYVHGSKKKNVFDGDTVEAQVKMYRGRKEAEITKIIKRAKRVVVGTFMYGKTKQYAFISPSNPLFTTDIYVEQQYFGGAEGGEIVGVEIINRKKKNPEGKVVYLLGKQGGDPQVEQIILEAGWPLAFPKEVIQEAEKLSLGDDVIAGVNKKRKDLRGLFTFTIDGADSKDLDDAISIESHTDGGYILYVHIADVAHFVPFGSALDKEAYCRSTSVYLVDRVLPMLPPQLSNDLCSLHPHTAKLTLTCEMHLDAEANIQQVEVYESIIESDARLTYRDVDMLLSGVGCESIEGDGDVSEKLTDSYLQKNQLGPIEVKNIQKNHHIKNTSEENKNTETLLFGGEITPTLKDTLCLAQELKQKLLKKRKQRGALDFHFPESKIVLDKEGKVIKIEPYPVYESHKLIEVFMVLANTSVGRKYHDIPFLYRVHEAPAKEDLEKLQEILKTFHIAFDVGVGTTKDFAKLLSFIRKYHHKDFSFLQKFMLRTLSKAIYSPVNKGHFGLGLQFYSHFTSPIRRYPDLQIHRIIKELGVKSGKLKAKRDVPSLSEEWVAFYKKHLKKVGEHTTNQEIKAQELERKVRDYFITQFYEDKVGQEFEGVINGMIPKGIFVSLADTAEGIIMMGRKGFLDEERLERRNAREKKTVRMGDTLRVKLIHVDMVLFRLEFEIVSV